MMRNQNKSYLKKSVGELLNDIDQLGGGINVKLTSQELVCMLPSLHSPLLTEGKSTKEHMKDVKYLLLSSGNLSKPKEFKYSSVMYNTVDLNSFLMSEQYFKEWFLAGFNLNMLFIGQCNVHRLALQILQKYKDFSDCYRVQSVRFSPRSGDNFQTENIEDIFTSKKITKFEESAAYDCQQSITQLEYLSSREQLSSKFKTIETEVVRITFTYGNQSSELNLIHLYQDLFIHSPQKTKYESSFEKALTGILAECKAIKYVADSDALQRISVQKTRLLEFLKATIFTSAKNILVADFSPITNPLSPLSKYENILSRLVNLNKFSEITILCHRYSSKSALKGSDYPSKSGYNSFTRCFESQFIGLSKLHHPIPFSNIDDDRLETKSTQRKDTREQKDVEEGASSLQRSLESRLSTQNQEGTKKSFKQEMKSLLYRIQTKQDGDHYKERSNIPQECDTVRQHTKTESVPSLNPQTWRADTRYKSEHSRRVEELQQQRIDELSLTITELRSRYESELNEQREIIKNQSNKIILIAHENSLSELILLYEAEIFRYIEMQKKLRSQISFLHTSKISNDETTKGLMTDMNPSQEQKQSEKTKRIKQKEMIASLNVELSEKDDEISKLRRDLRQRFVDSISSAHLQRRIADLQNQRDLLIEKNDELMNSLTNLNGIVENLRSENVQVNKSLLVSSQQIQHLQEDNNSLQQIISLQDREHTHHSSFKKINIKKLHNAEIEASARAAIEKVVSTLNRLTLKTGSNIPEQIISSFVSELQTEWKKMANIIESHKNSHRSVTDFLTNMVASLEITFGKNDKNVREVNKFVRDFLLESISGNDGGCGDGYLGSSSEINKSQKVLL